QQRLPAAGGQRHRQGSGHRSLAGASFAGDDMQARPRQLVRPHVRERNAASLAAAARRHAIACRMTTWEYATVPLLTHATKQILDQWGADGWELVTVMPGPTGEQLVAYLKRPKQ